MEGREQEERVTEKYERALERAMESEGGWLSPPEEVAREQSQHAIDELVERQAHVIRDFLQLYEQYILQLDLHATLRDLAGPNWRHGDLRDEIERSHSDLKELERQIQKAKEDIDPRPSLQRICGLRKIERALQEKNEG